jgi:hypothetical protein
MSYCRWSTDDFGCDLYVYEDVNGGWTIHIAQSRVVGEVPPVDWSLLDGPAGTGAEFVRQHKAQTDFVFGAEFEPINLPHAGQTFNLPTADEAAAKVEELLALGYRAPAYVAANLRAEADR